MSVVETSGVESSVVDEDEEVDVVSTVEVAVVVIVEDRNVVDDVDGYPYVNVVKLHVLGCKKQSRIVFELGYDKYEYTY